MKIKVSHIISFILGAGLLGIVFWIRSENNGVVSQSPIQDIVYKEQDRLNQQVKSGKEDKSVIINYRNKIEVAVAGIRAITSSRFIKPNSPDTILFKGASDLYNSIDAARSGIFRNIYDARQANNETTAEKELSTSFSNIDNQVFKYFRPFYNYFAPVYGATENKVKEEDSLQIIRFLADSTNLKNALSSITLVMDYENGRLEAVTKNTDDSIKLLQAQIDAVNNSLTDVEKATKDRLLMVVALPIFAIIIILLFVIPYLYRDNNSVMQLFFEERIILQVFTVFILVIAILLLGIGDKIKAETLGTLLGGISVYVLQNALGPNGKNSLPPPGNPNPPPAPGNPNPPPGNP